MVGLDHGGPRSIASLDRVREPVLDARVDLELVDPAREQLALDRCDERPHQAATPIGRIDEDVKEARTSIAPGRSRDGEADEQRTVRRSRHYGIAVCRLPAHLAPRERPGAPFLPLELLHSRTKIAPSGRIDGNDPDRRGHQRVTVTTRASPARSLMTRVSPPSEYWRRCAT